ncbi:MAG: methyltransferase domain-containing protein [Actinomycetota bacterium]|nr:methyltransferase domain-containing protein [Actinomycetota bacterium]
MDRALLSGDVDVIDLACGTGNAALLAAGRGARVVGVDGSSRLLDVAHERARAQGLEIDFRKGDLADLPVASATADLVVSIFGLIFAPQPAQALREVSRVLRPGGRMLMTAWIPAGPIDAMIGAMGRVVARVSRAPRSARFAWSDPNALGPLAEEAGLTLQATMPALLPVRDHSPEAYLLGAREHPMAVAARPVIERAGVGEEVREAMAAVLREANEDPNGFLVHSPYVVHDLLAI